MHVQASQAIYMAPVLSAGDTIPFKAALALSLIAIAAVIGQICKCHDPILHLAWHLAFGIWASGIWGHMTVARDEAKGSCTLGNLER
jgi:hypothetical protein